MISATDLEALIQRHIPDADVQAIDKTGMEDHYMVGVASSVFDGLNLIQQRQKVYEAVDAALKDGRLHAIEIKTIVKA